MKNTKIPHTYFAIVKEIGDSLGIILNKEIVDFMGLKRGNKIKQYPE